jgi:hypothetical protein
MDQTLIMDFIRDRTVTVASFVSMAGHQRGSCSDQCGALLNVSVQFRQNGIYLHVFQLAACNRLYRVEV